jgi:cytochrome d ubiquinol oxidase subunit I
MLRGRRDRRHRIGFLIPFTVAAIATPIQFAVGDTAARAIANDQPVKFAAMECVQHTHSDVTEYIYGRCTSSGIKGGIGIPGFDSFLVGFSTDTKVTGLDTVPPADRPPANTLLHWAFDTMVGICTALIALGAWLGIVWWRRRELPRTKWFLRASALAGAAAILALECGWIVTEVGRQPWIVYDILRTKNAVTTAGGVPEMFAAILVLYAVVFTVAVLVLRGMARRWREGEVGEEDVPYGPPPPVTPEGGTG